MKKVPPPDFAGSLDAANHGRVNKALTEEFGEVVQTITSNASEHGTNWKGEMTVKIKLAADKFGKVVVLQVEDSGPGIPEAERDLVFQPFYRALGTDADGSGLGLPIVMEIAHQHAAIVTLEDAYPGKPMPGARFSVRFSNTQA